MDGNQTMEVMRRNAAFRRLPIVALTPRKATGKTADRPDALTKRVFASSFYLSRS
jgi:hypothetical protein